MKEWFISGSVHLAIGFIIGWLLFKRPDLMTRGINWVRAKVGI